MFQTRKKNACVKNTGLKVLVIPFVLSLIFNILENPVMTLDKKMMMASDPALWYLQAPTLCVHFRLLVQLQAVTE